MASPVDPGVSSADIDSMIEEAAAPIMLQQFQMLMSFLEDITEGE